MPYTKRITQFFQVEKIMEVFMGTSLNKVELIGRIGRKPELKHTSSGKTLARFSLATDEYAGPDKDPKPEWHEITVWDKQAEYAEKFIDKGDLVRVEGSFRKREYEKDEVKKLAVDITGRHVMLLAKKNGSGGKSDTRPAEDTHVADGHESAPVVKERKVTTFPDDEEAPF